MDIIGKSPVSMPALLAGKLAFLGCLIFPFVGFAPDSLTLYNTPPASVVGIALYIAGLVVVVASLLHLGESAAVGLPDRVTLLRTHGFYRFSRNPIYLGGFIMCAGSCLSAPHALNFLLVLTAVAIHIRIIRREEEFLENRFGEEWLDYKARVPRYVGRFRSPKPKEGS